MDLPKAIRSDLELRMELENADKTGFVPDVKG